ncbi:hypothetical protein ACFQFG_15780 [Methylobacterium persicinum]
MKANAVRTATAVGADVKAIAGATGAAVAAEGATLQSVASAFTAAAVTSNTATASARAGVAATATALGTVSAQLPALGQLAVALGVAGGAYLTISTAVSAANAQIARFTALSAEAERTGFGIGILQRFQDVAKEAGLAVEEIDHALRHAAQATTPRFEQDNPVRKQLTDLFQSGYTGDFQSKGLADYLGARDAETRLRAVVTALRELRDLGLSLAAVDLAEKVFGADTAERIRTGRLDIEAIADALDRKRDDLITQEQVDRAVDFRDRLDAAYAAIAKVLETSLAVTEAGYAIDRAWLAVVETTARAAVNAGQFLDAMLKAARAGDGQSPLAPRQRLPGEGSLGADLGEIAGQSARGRTLYDRPIGPERPAEFITDPPEPPRRPLSFFTEQAHARPAHPRDGGAGAAADPLETFVHGLEKSAAAAKAEAEAFDRSDAEKNVAVQLARAQEIASQNGRSLTEAETQAVTRAAHAVAQYRDQLADLEQQQRQGAETARFFGDTVANSLADAIVNGRTFADILRGVQAQLGRAALQAVFTGQGPLAGPFGTAPAASARPAATRWAASPACSAVGSPRRVRSAARAFRGQWRPGPGRATRHRGRDGPRGVRAAAERDDVSPGEGPGVGRRRRADRAHGGCLRGAGQSGDHEHGPCGGRRGHGADGTAHRPQHQRHRRQRAAALRPGLTDGDLRRRRPRRSIG